MSSGIGNHKRVEEASRPKFAVGARTKLSQFPCCASNQLSVQLVMNN